METRLPAAELAGFRRPFPPREAQDHKKRSNWLEGAWSGDEPYDTHWFASDGAGDDKGGEGGAAPVFRAWDKKTGAVVAEIQVPGPTTGFPVTYTNAGRQYIAVAVREANAVEIVALALPAPAPAGRGGRGGRGGQWLRRV